jgi:hypothetical protein
MQNRFLKLNWHILIFITVICIYAISLYQRSPEEDEAVIAGHSYFLNTLGYVKSDLYGGYLEGKQAWEIRQFAYHKLFVLTGSLFMNVFGFNLYGFKLVSLLFSLLFLAVLYRYLKKFTPDFTVPFYLLTCSLLIFNNTYFDHSFKFRPEIMVMCLGFISFYFLECGLRNKSRYWFLLSGMFAGLAAFAHLNGLIYSFAGILLLLAKRDFRNFFLFSIPAGIFSLLYLFDIHNISEFQAMLYQFKTDPNVFDKVPFFIGFLNEHMRFFHSPAEIAFSSLFIFSLGLNFNFFRKHQPDLLLYLLFLVIGLSVLSHSKTPKYLLNYIPYMSIIIVMSFREIAKLKSLFKLAGGLFLLAFVGIHGYYNITLINQRIDIAKHNQLISNYIKEKNVKISAPSVFAFNEILNYTIRGEIAWDHHYYAFHPGEERSLESYFIFARKNDDKYIIFDKTSNTRLALLTVFNLPLRINDSLYGYKVLERAQTFIILKRL